MNEFTWFVHDTGHQLVIPSVGGIGKSKIVTRASVEASKSWQPENLCIEPAQSTRSKKRMRQYAPLKEPGLFRTFVDLSGEPDSIVNFADRFGLLTNVEKGEPFATWKTAITELRTAVECWETALSDGGDSVKVARPTQPRGQDIRNYRLPVSLKNSSDAPLIIIGAGLSSSLPDREVAHALASSINEKISNIRPVFISHVHDDPLADSLELLLMPNNLLEAIWLQFGQAVASNKSFRKCRQCDDWFELSPKVARNDKIFCTDACKAKAYRRRLADQVQV
jgi:hypothetical protein